MQIFHLRLINFVAEKENVSRKKNFYPRLKGFVTYHFLLRCGFCVKVWSCNGRSAEQKPVIADEKKRNVD